MPAIQRTGIYTDNVQTLGERYLVSTLAEGLSERGHSFGRASGPGALFPHRPASAVEESKARANRELRTTLLSQNRGRETSVADTLRRADEFLNAGPSPKARPSMLHPTPPGEPDPQQEVRDLAARAARVAFAHFASSSASARGSTDPAPAGAESGPGTGSGPVRRSDAALRGDLISLGSEPGALSSNTRSGRLAQVARGTCGPWGAPAGAVGPSRKPSTAGAKRWLGAERLAHLRRLRQRNTDRDLHHLPEGASRWLAHKAARRKFRVRVLREGLKASQAARIARSVATEEERGAQPAWLVSREEGARVRDEYMSTEEVQARGQSDAAANEAHHLPRGRPNLTTERPMPKEEAGHRHLRRASATAKERAKRPALPDGDDEAVRLPNPKAPRYDGGRPASGQGAGLASQAPKGKGKGKSEGKGKYAPKGKGKDSGPPNTSSDKGSAKGSQGPKGKSQGRGQGGGSQPPAPLSEEERAAHKRQQAHDRMVRRTKCMPCERDQGLQLAPLSDVRLLNHIVVCRDCAPGIRRCPVLRGEGGGARGPRDRLHHLACLGPLRQRGGGRGQGR